MHAVYNVLCRASLQTAPLRRKYGELLLSSRGRELAPRERLEVIQEVTISRFTFYKWKKRWEVGGEEVDALSNRMQRRDMIARRVSPKIEKTILSIAATAPTLSKYQLKDKVIDKLGPVVGVHGVYNVLNRNNLTLSSARTHRAVLPVPVV